MTWLETAATIGFWAGLAYIGYVYVGFFVLLSLAAHLFGRPRFVNPSCQPTVSLLISAYNEEKVIRAKLVNALAQDYPENKYEVCLISDGSTDMTADIGRAMDNPQVVVFDFKKRRGKNAALNDVRRYAKGEIFVFTDANTLYKPDAVAKLVRNFADPEVGLVVGNLNFVSDAGEQVDGGLYWRMENRIKALQSALRSVLVANGSIFAVRTEIMRPLHNDVANDFQTPMEVGGRGYAIVYEPEAVALEKSASDQREEFARKVRIVTRGMTGTSKLLKHIRGRRLFFFVSHKLLRWFVGYAQLLMLVCSAVLVSRHPVYAIALAGQVILYSSAIVGWCLQRRTTVPKIFQIPFYLCMVNLAAMVASFRFIRGKGFSTWEKAESAR